ncbi:serine/threonine-protein kinase fray2 isoform X3 [Punica granatum]|uniref:Serine/threonine-protein kinase fray2 isoform X3 n=1 Tax=Punica granatum TaxID=22663 RepID=A0A6P8D6H5_PUNGR|nr:serine/threonine-protein kinase fray2 isoform X3 [Punica granatum]
MKSKHGRDDADRETEKRKYPIGPEHYTLYEEVGQGVSASVHRALCIPFNEVVAIKILDFERDNCDLNSICREAQTMILVDHPNVLRAHCSFVNDHNLWVVMPYMAGGSCLHILKAAYPDGFEEVVIATILKEALKGLEYLHHHGHIHRDVKAGNILIDSRGAIKLGDFGVSACLFDSGDRQRTRNTFVGTPCWMAPEVMEQLHGYDFKADIWSFGITALELAHGHAPFSKYPPMKVLLMTLQSAPPGLDYERDRKFSKSFKQMIASCLVKDQSKRPTSKKLLKHSFFRQARSSDYIARTLLEGLPALGDRIQALKRKEEDMVAQKKMPDGEKEEISQNEYKRGISGWNFNLDDMKAQASLIQDIDEAMSMSDSVYEGSTSSSSTVDGQARILHPQMSCLGNAEYYDTEDNDGVHNQSAPLPLVDPTTSIIMHRAAKSEDDLSVASSSHEVHEEHNDNKSIEKPDSDISGKGLEGIATISNSNQRKGGSSNGINLVDFPNRLTRVESGKMQILPHVHSNGNISTVSSADDIISELPARVAANNDDLDEKAKVPVVQQRGRFKVTSENVDLEKVVPSPGLQKSHSMQVIAQHPTMSASPVPSPSPCDPVTSALPSGNSLLSTLYSFLQTNIQQRECILTLLKQAAAGELTAHRPTDGGGMQANSAATDKTLLEAAHDREKELLHEITELQWRLICAQDELKRLKSENSHQNDDRILGQKLPTRANGD